MLTPIVHPVEPVQRERGSRATKPFLVPQVEGPASGDKAEPMLGQPLRYVRTMLHRWHLFSLDAPTIATLWTALIARSAGVALPATSLVAMFLVVWMLYAADRLLDARPLRDALAVDRELLHSVELEPRHRFHHQHRRYFLVTLVCVTGVLGALLPSLPIAALRLDLLLGTMLAGYFVMIHVIEGVRLPKEIAVGLFFAAAVFIPTISCRPELRAQLAPMAMLFAAVCSFNCLAIYRWEHIAASRQGAVDGQSGMSRPHALTLWATNHLRPIGCCLLLGTIAATWARGPGRPDCIAIAAAIAALLLLDVCRDRFAPVTLRALADLALATPLLVWPIASPMLRR